MAEFEINLSDEDQREYFKGYQAFPDNHTLAQLAQYAYPKCRQDLKRELEGKGWEESGSEYKKNGFVGIAMKNQRQGHIVICIKGTNPKSLSDLNNDRLLAADGFVPYLPHAYALTQAVVNHSLVYEKFVSISATGHSLGGWLAALSAFCVKNPIYFSSLYNLDEVHDEFKSKIIEPAINYNYHIHVVSFDPPGPLDHFLKLGGNPLPYDRGNKLSLADSISLLDLTIILSQQNLVNTCRTQEGYVVRLEIKPERGCVNTIKNYSNPLRGHEIKGIVDYLGKEEKSIKELHYARRGKSEILDPLQINLKNRKFLFKVWDLNKESSYGLDRSVFNSNDIQLLQQIQTLSECIQGNSSKDEMMNELNSKYPEVANILELCSPFEIRVEHRWIQVSKLGLESRKLNTEGFVTFIKCLIAKHFGNAHICDNLKFTRDIVRSLACWKQKFFQIESKYFEREFPCLKSDFDYTKSRFCVALLNFLENANVNRFMIELDETQKSATFCMAHILAILRNTNCLFLGGKVLHTFNLQIPQIFDISISKIIVIYFEQALSHQTINEILGSEITDPKKKLILVKHYEFQSQLGEKYTFSNQDKETMDFGLNDLELSRNFVETKFKINGQALDLGNLEYIASINNGVGNHFKSGLICRFFDGEIINLTQNDDTKTKFYIERHVRQTVLDFEKLKKFYTKNVLSLFVLSCSEQDQEILTELFREITTDSAANILFVDLNFTDEKFSQIQSDASNRNVNYFHWFRWDGMNLVYYKSNEKDLCKHYLNDQFHENNLLGLNNQIFIFCDDPGMGKSNLLYKLFKNKDNPSSTKIMWKIWLDLNHCKKNLREFKGDIDINSLVAFLLSLIKPIGCGSDDINNLLGFILKLHFNDVESSELNLHVFVDSFDEISHKSQLITLNILEFLTSHTANVYISTRLSAKCILEKKLGVKGYLLKEFNEEEQIKFLMSYFKNSKTLEHAGYKDYLDYIEKYVKAILDEIKNTFTVGKSFIGIPLHLNMIADLQLESISEYLKNVKYSKYPDRIIPQDFMIKFKGAFKVYKEFTKEKFQRTLGNKWKSSDLHEELKETLFNRLEKLHESSSFVYKFPEQEIIDIPPNFYNDLFENMDSINNMGICQIILESATSNSISSNDVRFIHETLAEFYCARYLFRLLVKAHKRNKIKMSKVLAFLKHNYYKHNFKQVRYFLDSLLCQSISTLPCLEMCESLCPESVIDFSEDILGRNIFHYYGLYASPMLGIFWLYSMIPELFGKYDELGMSWLSYSILRAEDLKYEDGILSYFYGEYFWLCLNNVLGDIRSPFTASKWKNIETTHIIQCIIDHFKNRTESIELLERPYPGLEKFKEVCKFIQDQNLEIEILKKEVALHNLLLKNLKENVIKTSVTVNPQVLFFLNILDFSLKSGLKLNDIRPEIEMLQSSCPFTEYNFDVDAMKFMRENLLNGYFNILFPVYKDYLKELLASCSSEEKMSMLEVFHVCVIEGCCRELGIGDEIIIYLNYRSREKYAPLLSFLKAKLDLYSEVLNPNVQNFGIRLIWSRYPDNRHMFVTVKNCLLGENRQTILEIVKRHCIDIPPADKLHDFVEILTTMTTDSESYTDYDYDLDTNSDSNSYMNLDTNSDSNSYMSTDTNSETNSVSDSNLDSESKLE